jgi:hypothetical protein
MKRIALIAILFVLMSGLALAQEKCISSGKNTSSAVVLASPGTYCGVRGITNGTNNTTCAVYNNATAGSGIEVDEWTTLGSNYSGGDNAPEPGVTAGNGLYVTVTTTGGGCIVYYRVGN